MEVITKLFNLSKKIIIRKFEKTECTSTFVSVYTMHFIQNGKTKLIAEILFSTQKCL